MRNEVDQTNIHPHEREIARDIPISKSGNCRTDKKLR